MSTRETIDKKKGDKATNLATRVFAVVVATFFVILFANAAMAAENNMITLKGQVVAVDNHAQTVTVLSIEKAGSSDMMMTGEYTFAVDKVTNVTSCTENKTFNYIGAGETVTVTYHEYEGKLIADAIDIPASDLVCYDR
ncbi:MAG TPA: hypothetical protein VLD55_02775 [Candidatus Sulfobium mesophilum]|nr:hypothetical protein [Candidatus Sulfobium mesophilum]